MFVVWMLTASSACCSTQAAKREMPPLPAFEMIQREAPGRWKLITVPPAGSPDGPEFRKWLATVVRDMMRLMGYVDAVEGSEDASEDAE